MSGDQIPDLRSSIFEESGNEDAALKLLKENSPEFRTKPDSKESIQLAGILDYLPKLGWGSDSKSGGDSLFAAAGHSREYRAALRELNSTPPPRSALKEGDIIFHKSRSEQSEFISMATDSPLTHMGILVKENGKWKVYEASKKVSKTDLDTFIARGEGGKYLVRRVDENMDQTTLNKMRSYLDANLNKNYDSLFMWSDQKQYCSELVWKAYKHASGAELGKPKAMRDYPIGKDGLRQKVEERWGQKLPLNELMIAPADIYKSRLLKPVRN